MALHRTKKKQPGFTLVELVTVVVLLGILSALIAPRLNRASTDGRNFFDRALSSIRFAQKLSIARRSPVYVCIGTESVAVGYAAGCVSALANDPGGGVINFNNTSVSMSELEFSFDGQGQMASAQDITVNVPSTGDAFTLRVENLTGYVHPI